MDVNVDLKAYEHLKLASAFQSTLRRYWILSFKEVLKHVKGQSKQLQILVGRWEL